MTPSPPDHRPVFPADPLLRGGVAVLGCGGIARTAHLPAYEKYDVGVVGTWSRTRTEPVRDRFPFVGREYDTADELFADPEVRIVDVATPAAGRLGWIRAAVAAGKHVLAQKPLTTDAAELAELPDLLAEADRQGVVVAVNHNGRWAPAWRLATLLVRAGAVGDVVGVTHLHDKPLPPLAGTPFDRLDHMLVTDYLLHWIDISRTWLEPARVVQVQAFDSRVPGQPAESRNPWSATVAFTTGSGATAAIRVVGDARASDPSCPFWIHGTDGTLRGSVLTGSDSLSLDRDGRSHVLPLHGQWFVDGFAGAMGELMCAVAEGREPENAAADGAVSVAVMVAARESAGRSGAPVAVYANRPTATPTRSRLRSRTGTPP